MIACLLVTHLAAKLELARHPELSGRPLLIHDGPAVLDFSREARGVTPGMPLTAALARCKDAALLQADLPFYQEAFSRLVQALLQVSPLVEPDGLGCAYLDLRGLLPLYGGEDKLITALLSAAPADWSPRLGLAQARFPACVAALAARGGCAVRVPQDAAAFLRPFSVDLLPLSWEDKARLHRFGLHTLGQFAAQPLGAVQAQFGPQGRRAWELARGIDPRPLAPLRPQEDVSERLQLPFGATSREALFAALELLLRKAFLRPQLRGRHVGRVALHCGLLDGSSFARTLALKEPAGSWERALSAIKSLLGDLSLPGPVEEVSLTLSDFSPEQGVQARAFQDVHQAHGERQRRLVSIDRKLQARTGERALFRIVQVDPQHPVPEMRAVQVPVDPEAAGAIRPINSPVPVSVQEVGGMPGALLLGRRRLEVSGTEDLWQIDLWWLPRPIRRLYCVLQGKDGRRITVFRDMVEGGWYRQDY